MMDTSLQPVGLNLNLDEDIANVWDEEDSDSEIDLLLPEDYSDTEYEEDDEYGFSISPTRHEIKEGEM